MREEKIMIVEDEMIIAQDIKKIVQICGYEVCCMARSGEDAIQKANNFKPDLVLMDIMLESKMTGMEAAHTIHQNLNIPFVFVSAYADDITLHKAIKTGPYGYIVKPFEEKELKVILELALYKFKMENKLKKSQEKYHHIFENIQDIYCEFDLDMKILEISPSIKDYTGWTRKDLIGKSVTELFLDYEQINILKEEIKNIGFINDYEILINSKKNNWLNSGENCIGKCW